MVSLNTDKYLRIKLDPDIVTEIGSDLSKKNIQSTLIRIRNSDPEFYQTLIDWMHQKYHHHKRQKEKN